MVPDRDEVVWIGGVVDLIPLPPDPALAPLSSELRVLSGEPCRYLGSRTGRTLDPEVENSSKSLIFSVSSAHVLSLITLHP